MPTRTLLQIVKKMAQKTSSDEVTTLSEDSIEIQDMVDCALEVLEDIVYRNDWEFLKDHLTQLEAGSNAIELAIPSNVRRIQNLRYRQEDGGVQVGFRTLRYMYPNEFLMHLQKNKPTDANTTTVTINGVDLYPKTNKHPTYWTSFDEQNVVLDSYDSVQNPTGLDATDSAIIATLYLDFTGSDADAWVAPIPESLFTLWEQEAVAEAFVQFRQTENPRAERRSRRTYVQQIKKEPVTHKDEGSDEVNYGRR